MTAEGTATSQKIVSQEIVDDHSSLEHFAFISSNDGNSLNQSCANTSSKNIKDQFLAQDEELLLNLNKSHTKSRSSSPFSSPSSRTPTPKRFFRRPSKDGSNSVVTAPASFSSNAIKNMMLRRKGSGSPFTPLSSRSDDRDIVEGEFFREVSRENTMPKHAQLISHRNGNASPDFKPLHMDTSADPATGTEYEYATNASRTPSKQQLHLGKGTINNPVLHSLSDSSLPEWEKENKDRIQQQIEQIKLNRQHQLSLQEFRNGLKQHDKNKDERNQLSLQAEKGQSDCKSLADHTNIYEFNWKYDDYGEEQGNEDVLSSTSNASKNSLRLRLQQRLLKAHLKKSASLSDASDEFTELQDSQSRSGGIGKLWFRRKSNNNVQDTNTIDGHAHSNSSPDLSFMDINDTRSDSIYLKHDGNPHKERKKEQKPIFPREREDVNKLTSDLLYKLGYSCVASDEDEDMFGNADRSASTNENIERNKHVTSKRKSSRDESYETQEDESTEIVPKSNNVDKKVLMSAITTKDVRKREVKLIDDKKEKKVALLSLQNGNRRHHFLKNHPSKQHSIVLTSEDQSLQRLSRQFRNGHRGEVPATGHKKNSVRIHVYDLIASETYMQLPWGCEFPIGQCFNVLNSGLHALGTGAYHCGVEVNGIEFAFGSNDIKGLSGVFTCVPKQSPGYEYRTTLDFGERQKKKCTWINVPKAECLENSFKNMDSVQNRNKSKSHGHSIRDKKNKVIEKNNLLLQPLDYVYRWVESNVDGETVMKEMAKEYMGVDYDLLRKNCCTFARDACLRLGVEEHEIPTWFLNIAEAGAVTEDALVSMDNALLKPIQQLISPAGNGEKEEEQFDMDDTVHGFETIAENKIDCVGKSKIHVVESIVSEDDAKKSSKQKLLDVSGESNIGIRETFSWTY